MLFYFIISMYDTAAVNLFVVIGVTNFSQRENYISNDLQVLALLVIIIFSCIGQHICLKGEAVRYVAIFFFFY